jgi:CRISP-associated protein Cas1
MKSLAHRPTPPTELVRVADRISFLYLQRCVVSRDSNAITVKEERGTVHIPAAAVSVLLLGPGSTITHQAVNLLSDSGSTAVWVGEQGVRFYASGNSLARSSRLLQAQAAAVSNQRSRLRVARTMYQMRFPDDDVSKLTMQQLRGREGARVRRMYREHSHRTGVEWTRRNYDVDNWEADDAINQALSAAHAALYGVVHAVIVALGCSPALGFIHTGHHRSFVYDIADLYKSDVSVPVAFDVAADCSGGLGAETRRRMRDRLHDGKLLTRCAGDIQTLLLGASGEDADAQLEAEVLSLWDDRGGAVPAGVLYEEAPF